MVLRVIIKVLKSAKENNFMKDIIEEVKELSENKELNPPITKLDFALSIAGRICHGISGKICTG